MMRDRCCGREKSTARVFGMWAMIQLRARRLGGTRPARTLGRSRKRNGQSKASRARQALQGLFQQVSGGLVSSDIVRRLIAGLSRRQPETMYEDNIKESLGVQPFSNKGLLLLHV
jgi:hypothetical protein